MSRYDADDVYCIPGTAVLKNKAGITDQDLLDAYEGDFTAIRLLELAQDTVEGYLFARLTDSFVNLALLH
jgi:cell filamentation protein